VLTPFRVSAAEGLAYGLVLQAIEIVSAIGLGLPATLHEGLRLGELRREPGGALTPAAGGHA
jgi:hypothetical protein